eukprot:jgi/Tetstr1/420378/TSEL_011494.t1
MTLPLRTSKKGVIGAETAMADENEGRYAMGGVLGAGSFGSVHRAVDKHIGQAVAIKVLSTATAKQREEAEHEVAMNKLVLQRSRLAGKSYQAASTAASAVSPPLLDAFERRGPDDNIEMCLVFPLMEGGTLESLLQNGKHFTEADTKTVMRRLLAIIAALHDCGVAHCDIKPANLMLETPGNLDSLKLIDLGFASDLRKTAQLSVSQGTALYLAPELVRVFRSPDQKGHYGLQVDEWAAGVTMYRLLCGRQPFNGRSIAELWGHFSLPPPAFG